MVGHGVPYLNRLVGQGVAASANLLPQATVVAVESGAQVRLQNVAVEHKGGGVDRESNSNLLSHNQVH